VKVDVDCFVDCPDCIEAFETVASSVTPIPGCEKFEITVPEEFLECFTFQVFVGGQPFDLVANTNTIPTNGFDNFDLHIYTLGNPDEPCFKDGIGLDCCPECDPKNSGQILEVFWNTLDFNEERCGEYWFKGPELDDCYEILVDWGDGSVPEIVTQADFETAISHQYDTNGTYEICTQVLLDGKACGDKKCNKVEVTCFEDCPDCNPRTNILLQNALWNSFVESPEKCGVYGFEIPSLDHCYEILIDWGDGTSNTVSQLESGTPLWHQYDINNVYNICTQIYVDGQVCTRKQCNEIRVDCYRDCTDCTDNVAAINTLNELAATISPGVGCGEFTISAFDTILECYDVSISLGVNDGTGLIPISAGLNEFSYTFDGDFTVGIFLFDPVTGAFCEKLGVPVSVDCFGCIDCQSFVDNVYLDHVANNIYNIVANVVPECFQLNYHINGFYQGLINATSTSIILNEGDTIFVTLYEIDNPTGNNCSNDLTPPSGRNTTPSGIYFVDVTTEKGELHRKQLIIKR